jgi:HAD superfamily hydrolase (TIGR01509 family)
MRAAIFDFDETIIDLEPQHTAAHRALCRTQGCDYDDMPESFRTGSGRRIIDDIRMMREHFGWSEAEEELMEVRQRVFDEVCAAAPLELMPGAERVIRELHAIGVKLAIASSAVGSSIDAILRRFRLRDCFEVIVDGGEVRQGKPDPESYLLTARRLGAEPRDCVVFEDSHVGVVAAKRAGMRCIAIRNPRAQQRQDLAAADVVLESFEQLDVRTVFAPTAR